MNQCSNENAANRTSYVAKIHNEGERTIKNNVISRLPDNWSRLHEEGYIHIHDLDAYGLTYNCLAFNVLNNFPYEKFAHKSDDKIVVGVFRYITDLLCSMGNEQSGGMSFGNFDNELAEIFEMLGLTLVSRTKEMIAAQIENLILWCNDTHSRMGQTSYYVSFNVGLASSEFARFIAHTLIDEFSNSGELVYKPNIIFKVAKGINRSKDDINYDLYENALRCTAKKMIPTYLLCDSESNAKISPDKLSIMGCRTRVVDDLYGEIGSIGRGNIANVSINLPRLALETLKECAGTIAQKYEFFISKWDGIAKSTKDILIHRYKELLDQNIEEFPANIKSNLWCVPFDDLTSVFKHGTLSIGFIGLSEAMEIILGSRYYENMNNYISALGFVRHMREYCDLMTVEHQLNFSLLASSGELISGRFIDIDKKLFDSSIDIFDKGFYTNSFHINVDSDLIAFDKIKFEGLFHSECNGGSITYIESREAPIGNVEGLMEYIEYAIENGVNYIGLNFPKDICNACSESGIFDICPTCGSESITRIRRVSGYLEVFDGFTSGKKNEVLNRKENKLCI